MRSLKFFLVFAFVLLIGSCGYPDVGPIDPDQIRVNDQKLMSSVFPADKRALDVKKIPKGNYKIQSILTKKIDRDKDSADYAALHVLDNAGVFSSAKDKTNYEVDWKGLDKDLEEDEYYQSYLEQNLPGSINASGAKVVYADNFYYYNRVQTNRNQLGWGAQKEAQRMAVRSYAVIFLEGVLGSENIYTHDFNFRNVSARGIAYLSGSDLKLAIEYHIDKGDPDQVLHLIELTYEKQ